MSELLAEGALPLVLILPLDPDQAIADDRLNGNRIGLDLSSLIVAACADLDIALERWKRHFCCWC